MFLDAVRESDLTNGSVPNYVNFNGRFNRFSEDTGKSKDKPCWYVVQIDADGVAHGAFGSWKGGLASQGWHSIYSAKGHKLTKRERDEMEARRAACEAMAREADRQETKAKKLLAIEYLESGAKITDENIHPYLLRKQVSPHPDMRLNHAGDLLIPIYNVDAQVIGLQRIFIDEDGSFEKRYLGAKQGGHLTFGQVEHGHPDTIVICEGVSTGASIYASTGYPTVVAFDCGGLMPIAKIIHQAHPNAQIIIAADDDAKTSGNPGVDHAIQAAQAIPGAEIRIAVPDFGPVRDIKLSDFNDLQVTLGPEAVKASFAADKIMDVSGALKFLSAERLFGPQPAPDKDEAKGSQSEQTDKDSAAKERQAKSNRETSVIRCISALTGRVDKQGNAIHFPNLHNAIVILGTHPDWHGVLGYDSFKASAMIMKQPPSHKPEDFVGRGEFPVPIQDVDDILITSWLQKGESIGPWSLNLTVETTRHAVQAVISKNKFHVVQEWMNSLVWDNEPRLNTWLSRFLGAKPSPYTSAVGTSFLISSVARIFQPGCKADTVLILEGKQGAGKSRAAKTLAKHQDWFTDQLGKLDQKDTVLALQGALIVEIAELGALVDAEPIHAKAFLSRTSDRIRKPYERHVAECPRQCVFIGTTNEQTTGYLKDSTGARRFWPIMCGTINIPALKENVDQLWAEAVARYKAGEAWWLDQDAEILAKDEQDQRKEIGSWDDAVFGYLNNKQAVSLSMIYKNALNIHDYADRSLRNDKRLSRLLTAHGWSLKRVVPKEDWYLDPEVVEAAKKNSGGTINLYIKDVPF